MWKSWGDSLTHALEQTGDAITKAATNAGKSARKKSADPNSGNARSEPQPTMVDMSTAPKIGTDTTETCADRDATAETTAKDSLTDEKTGGSKEFRKKNLELFGNLQAGWSTVLETTRESIKNAQNVVEEQQSRITERIQKVRYALSKRDVRMPLDVEALQDACVVYITDRIITMGHPGMASTTNGSITAERKLLAVGHLLQKRHNGRYMVWNLSEVEYDSQILDEQVLTFSFPGSPSPPLGLLLKLLISMEAWMKADDRNVAVVHCLTGKGRTSTVLAAFLCWMGEAGFSDIYTALEYIAACKQLTTEELTIPSQRRYASYFKNMLDGVRPSQPPLMLRRIIMSEAPRYARGPPRKDPADGRKKGEGTTTEDNSSSSAAAPASSSNKSTAAANDEQLMGCAPYLQLFKAGKLLHTTPASLHFRQSSDELPFCQVADGPISFHVNQIIQGDMLVRCRHLTAKKQRMSMFRAAFHTGYVPPNVMRLTKQQLDGANTDDRFPKDFFIDLIFEPVDAEEASKLLQQQERDAKLQNAAADSSEAATGGTVTASTYDSMLHRDSRFWDVIDAHREEKAKKEAHAQSDAAGDDKPASTTAVRDDETTWGPTVGRRRAFDNQKAKKAQSSNASQKADSDKPMTGTAGSVLQTFSIGGELDFLPNMEVAEERPKATSEKPKKPDSLMEALMGVLGEKDDAGDADPEHEVVFFDDGNEKTTDHKPAAIPVSKEGIPASTATDTASPPQQEKSKESDPTGQPTSDEKGKDMDKLLDDANLNVDDDVNALLGDMDDDLDLEDAELEDLENMLSEKK